MNLVYSPQAASGSIVELDENEFHHLQVLRVREGESLNIFDGNGNLFEGRLATMSKKSATVQILHMVKNEAKPSSQLHIAIAPTKNIDRMEWFIEKATEIGVNVITPLICRRSERRELRIDRLEKVLLSAAKQSLHLHLAKLNAVVNLQTFLKANKDTDSKKFIAYCEEHTLHLRDSFAAGENITVLIGPEGDFTEEEVAMAKESGFIPVSLGASRLRTETAGVIVSAIFNLK